MQCIFKVTFANSFNYVTNYSEAKDIMSLENKEIKEEKAINKMSLLIVAVIILVLAIGGAIYYILKQQTQMDEIVQGYDLDKETLEDEFNELSLQYEGYKFDVGNDSLMSKLSTEQSKVQRLQEELRTIKSTNKVRIAELKKELSTLRRIMRNFVVQIDSLNTANHKLREEKKQVERKYRQASSIASKFKKETEKLNERVTMASKLNATAISVKAITGRGRIAKRISQIDQLVIDFKIAKNITAEVGEKEVYVRIMKPDDDILLKSRANVFAYENGEINYSLKRNIVYDGEDLPVTLYWKVEEFLSTGNYRIDIFIDGNRIGKKVFELTK